MAKKKVKKKTTTQKKNAAAQKKTSSANTSLVLVAAAILCLAAVIFVVSKGVGKKSDTSEADNVVTDTAETKADSGKQEMQVIEEGESLIIPVSEISSTAQFYPIEVDGTEMEVLAVKDSEGNIRTAFNTCQICYSSGRGYYVQNGDTLVCQNCGNQFTVDQVEVESGGCNPWPIFAENKTETEDSIEISYDFLKESKEIFANWKIYG